MRSLPGNIPYIRQFVISLVLDGQLRELEQRAPELAGRACLSQDCSVRRVSSLRRVSNLSSAGRVVVSVILCVHSILSDGSGQR